jgi:pimeloyl-ACP methyl ester carboxylesterase
MSSSLPFRRAYVTLRSGAQVHAVGAGEGPPVILLHASPLNAGFMAAQIGALAQAGFHAIGFDTPGYGASDPLPGQTSLEAYADVMLEAASTYAAAGFRLYGTATGAQIALAMAKRAPARIERMVLDNCGHFDPALRAAWEAGYFPDLTPQSDGGHLIRIWDMCRKQLTRFPWHLEPSPDATPAGEPSLATMSAMTLAYLQAGPAYDRAYRAAFHAEDISSFEGLDAPTVLLDWQGSVVAREIKALTVQALPRCVTVKRAGPSVGERLAAIVDAFQA